jgi:hypothetical protein
MQALKKNPVREFILTVFRSLFLLPVIAPAHSRYKDCAPPELVVRLKPEASGKLKPYSVSRKRLRRSQIFIANLYSPMRKKTRLAP